MSSTAAGPRDEKPPLGDIVSATGVAIGLITAWLYAAGWTYAYFYFDRFRIPLLMIDLPFEHYLVYGGLVVAKHPWAAALISILILVIVWALARSARALGRFGVCTILVVLIVAAFALARLGGIATARADFAQQRRSDYAAYPRVQLERKGGQAAPEGVLGDLANCGRLVVASKERMFLIRPVRGAASLDLDTFVVPLKEAEAFHIRADNTSCE